MPTLVLAGKDDILTPPEFGRAVAKAIRGARLAVLAGCHGLFIEQVDRFNRASSVF